MKTATLIFPHQLFENHPALGDNDVFLIEVDLFFTQYPFHKQKLAYHRATKPYIISSSNYLLKMSDFKRGDWQATWDGLFWRFMHRQRGFFDSNPRLGMLLRTWERMSAEKQQQHLNHAEAFLNQLND